MDIDHILLEVQAVWHPQYARLIQAVLGAAEVVVEVPLRQVQRSAAAPVQVLVERVQGCTF